MSHIAADPLDEEVAGVDDELPVEGPLLVDVPAAPPAPLGMTVDPPQPMTNTGRNTGRNKEKEDFMPISVLARVDAVQSRRRPDRGPEGSVFLLDANKASAVSPIAVQDACKPAAGTEIVLQDAGKASAGTEIVLQDAGKASVGTEIVLQDAGKAAAGTEIVLPDAAKAAAGTEIVLQDACKAAAGTEIVLQDAGNASAVSDKASAASFSA